MYNKDEILGFETDTVWGIGCHPLSPQCIQKIYEIKGREKDKPLILMSSKLEYLIPYIKNVPDYADNLIKNFFPGALTLIFEKTEICPNEVTSGKNTVGIRIPDHKGFMEIADNFEGRVLATTSLNKSGELPVKNYEEANELFSDQVRIVKPETPNLKNEASTVVLCTGDSPIVLRQGGVRI